jgi:transcription initiation factor TFIIH subunit 1
LAQAAADTQQKGKPGQLVDPRPETVEGEIRIRITPQLVHDIFDEYPVVAKAYSDNVPNKVCCHIPSVDFSCLVERHIQVD